MPDARVPPSTRVLVLHGGAGSIAPDLTTTYRQGLDAALDEGWAAFDTTREPALAAALAAVSAMEANPHAFNAGIGGAPTRDGVVELDAAVMTSDGSSGAVAAVRNTVHAARLADRVRRETPHALLVAHGAEALVEDGIDNASLLNERSRAALDRWRRRADAPTGSATVGAVARGSDGRLAAVTSTGGVLGQWSGRVGDTPVPGAGTYACDHVAVSCTGKGEAFLRAVTAKGLADALAAGEGVGAAVRAALEEARHLGGEGGLIALTRLGPWAFGHTAPAMAVAWRHGDARFAAVSRRPGVRVLPEPAERPR